MLKKLFNSISYFLVSKIFHLLAFSFFDVKVEGLENIPKKGRFIFAGNHQNFVDGAFITFFSPRKTKFLVAKRSVVGLAKFVLLTTGTSVNYEKNDYLEALKQLKKHLDLDNVIGIFPEGDVSRRTLPRKFKGGVSKLSIDSEAPVIPVYINGTFELRKLSYWFKRSKILLRFGKPFDLYKESDKYKFDLDKMAEILRSKIIELSGLKELVNIENKVISLEDSQFYVPKSASSTSL